jgi:hypothetical protein
MAAVPQPRIQARSRVIDLIADLPIVNDVDDMLREGVGSESVAKFIQETMGLMTNVAPKTLSRMLRERRESLPPPPDPGINPDEWPATGEGGTEPRPPGRLARCQYGKALRGIDRLLEVESLYLSTRDRIDWLMQQEKTEGEPYEKMYLEVASARELLKTHADLEREFGATGNRFRMSVEVSGRSSSELGQRVQKVLDNPESRHKVVDLVKRLKQAAHLPEPVETPEGS